MLARTLELLPFHRSSTYPDDGWDAFEVAAFCADALGEVPCLV